MQIPVDKELVRNAAEQFIHFNNPSFESLGNGLIHQTFKVTQQPEKKAIVLQALNQNVFKNPQDIVYNYQELFQFLNKKEGGAGIPAPCPAQNGRLMWKDEKGNVWRATEFVDDSYSLLTVSDEETAYTVARSFARFTESLSGLNPSRLKIIIPDFHNLSFRFGQFEQSVETASLERLLKSTHIITELRERKSLVHFYDLIQGSANYPSRVMHHDCKVSNILLEKGTGRVICPVDLDTVMSGQFYSDLGDMIRTMACRVDENSNHWEEIGILPLFYQAVIKGYLEGIGNILTEEEKTNIHYCGLIMIYMQALRFLTDFLREDQYYKTHYPEQNLNRALNQLILLERLEDYLAMEYSMKA
jgi:hypothetical protein